MLGREKKRAGGGRQLTIDGVACGRALAANEGSKGKGKAQEGGTELEWSAVAGDIDGDGRTRTSLLKGRQMENRGRGGRTRVVASTD